MLNISLYWADVEPMLALYVHWATDEPIKAYIILYIPICMSYTNVWPLLEILQL